MNHLKFNKKTTKIGDWEFQLGKVYPDIYARAFESKEPEVDEYVCENYYDYKELIEFLKSYKPEINEAKYQGRKVKLGKPMAGDVKKFKVYVKNDKGNVVKVNFGEKGVRIKKDNTERRKSFRARHNCDTPGPRWKARYWSCKKW